MSTMVAFEILVLICLGIARGLQPQDVRHTCNPFRNFIFWDFSKDENTFVIQRHFIFRIIQNAPLGSEIRLYAVGKTFNLIIDDVKDKRRKNKWIETITRVPRGNTENHIISYKSLEEAISEYSKEVVLAAEEIFFVIDDNSKIDDEKKANELLKRRKIFVVIHGTGPPSKFWTKLATDKHHLLKLHDNIDAGVDSFLALSCQDSWLYCNTIMYWTGDECKNCTHICSRTPAEDSKYCREACPYFRDTENTSEQSGCNNLVPYQGLIVVCFVCMLTLVV
ncbi:uncharacterized protein LOC128557772 isoform X2 [Mercenaria mercenaria]|uniref:uncharacterized protein LOC128557772 isoform X2 n=1 Tax=Mercenaria mercenaria TaxID=6596 RepID=UPI00234F90EE|nr:uncharacterized protein LOC128557772 isoform X2 [Mercenaria mercenaria]